MIVADALGQRAQRRQPDAKGGSRATDPVQGRDALRITRPAQFSEDLLDGHETTIGGGA
jgi:hypothetical protein